MIPARRAEYLNERFCTASAGSSTNTVNGLTDDGDPAGAGGGSCCCGSSITKLKARPSLLHPVMVGARLRKCLKATLAIT